MNDFKAIVRDFLRNHEQRDIRFRMNQSNVILLKVRFDEETDFIYMMSCCGDGDPLGDSLYMDNRPEYAGIYSVTHDRVICPSYYFGFCCDAEKSEDFRKEIASAVTRRIIELVNNSPVPVTEESRPFDSRIDYYSQHGAHEEALRWYFNDDLPHDYVPNVDPDEWLIARHLVMALNHREQCIEELANAYIRHYANRINLRLEELKLVQAEYDMLLTQKGEHFYQKRIAKAVENKDMKTVQLEIMKDGKPFSSKYDANILRNTGCCSYSTWYMPAASRSEFDRLYGFITGVMPSEIKRITYGRKTIYDAEKLEEEA